jgi:acetyltransferase
MSARACEDGQRSCRRLCHAIHPGVGDVVVRPIGPGDAALAQAFIDGLSARSRYHRFFAPLTSLSPSMLKLFTDTDPPRRVTLVGIARVEGRQSIVGEARFVAGGEGASADVAIVVADAWHRRGLGTVLMEMIEGIATASGIARLTGESLAGNDALRLFASRCGYTVRPDTADRRFLRIEKQLRAPPPAPGWAAGHGHANGLAAATPAITPADDRKEVPCPE